MSRACAHCGSTRGTLYEWDLRPCASPEQRSFLLCDPCDVALNRIVVEFLRLPDGPAILAAYEGRDR